MIHIILAGKSILSSQASLSDSYHIIAQVTHFIDAKEKVQEYVPDYLIAEMELGNGTAWDLLDLIKKQNLPTRGLSWFMTTLS